MSKVRETIVSNSEKKFVAKALAESKRLDGRAFDEFRQLSIQLGKDWGCCYVSLGKTRVLAQVSCEVQQPKSSRPSEGLLNINLELNPLGAPHFEAGRQSDLSVQLNRSLEKCLKDSKAIDLESLCIKVNEKVWAFRVDVNVLNYEGNILDAASVAALCALAHFRRPDVTSDGEEVVIHTYAQRDPIPTVVHHYPICISFAVFNDGSVVLSDPDLLEESVAEAHLTVGLNAYKELCALHLGGSALVSADLILATTAKAAARASNVIKVIKKRIEEDNDNRLKKLEIGFHCSLHENGEQFKLADESLDVYLDKWSVTKKKRRKEKLKEIEMDVDAVNEPLGTVEPLGKGCVVLLPQESADDLNKWQISSNEESESETSLLDAKPEAVPQVQSTSNKYDAKVEECIYKSKLEHSVTVGGTAYPFIQHLDAVIFCLLCENSVGPSLDRHLQKHEHRENFGSSKRLDSLKTFHDIWTSLPEDVHWQQNHFRKRRQKITCTLCSAIVRYCDRHLGDHLRSKKHQTNMSRFYEHGIGKIFQLQNCKITQQSTADRSGDDFRDDISGSEEENLVVLNADRQTSKKKRKNTS